MDDNNVISINERQFDRIYRNTQLSKLVELIGGVSVLKSRKATSNKPTAYTKDKTHFRIYEDAGTIHGIKEYIEASDSDAIAENYLVDLSQAIVKPQYLSKEDREEPNQAYSLIVVDIDRHDEKDGADGMDSFKELKEELDIPETLTVKTKGNGFHLYYYIPTKDIKHIKKGRFVGFVPGIDIFIGVPTGKSYTVAGPGSQAIKSNVKTKYEILKERHITKIPEDLLKRILASYNSISDELSSALTALEAARNKDITEDSIDNINKAESLLHKKVAEKTDHELIHGPGTKYANARDDSLNAFCYEISSFGLSIDRITDLASKFNRMCFEQPFNDDYITYKARNAYEARVKKNETHIKADHDIPSFDLYPISNGSYLVTHRELFDRLSAIPNNILKFLTSSVNGISLLSDITFITDSSYSIASKLPLSTTLRECQTLLNSKGKLSFFDLKDVVHLSELRFNTFSEAKYNIHVGDLKKDPGSPDNMTMQPPSKNTLFKHRVLRGLTKDFSRNTTGHVVNRGKLYVTAPHAFEEFRPLTRQQMIETSEVREKLFTFIQETITDVNDPKELEFLLDSMAAMVQGRNVPNLVVLFGKGGTGKSVFLSFLSLLAPASDQYTALTVDALTRETRFPLGTFTSVDDCDLNDTKQWNAIKSISTSGEFTIDEKFGPKYTVKKSINLFVASNYEIRNPDILNDRRVTVLKGYPIYGEKDFASIMDEIIRELFQDDLLAFRSVYQFFKERDISQTNWVHFSNYQLSLQHSNSQITDHTQRHQIDTVNKERELRRTRAIINMIANGGFFNESIPQRINLIEDQSIEHYKKTHPYIASSLDWLFAFTYYYELAEDKTILPSDFIEPMLDKSKFRDRLATFTKFVRQDQGENNIIREVMGIPLSPVDKKAPTKIDYNMSESVRVRPIVFAPIVKWLLRLSFITGNTLSEQTGQGLIDYFGIRNIADYILLCQENNHVPSREEFEIVFKRDFPNSILGELDVFKERGLSDKEAFDINLEEAEENW